MKKIAILATIITCLNAHAASEKVFFIKKNGKLVQVTKRDTMKLLLVKPKTEVFRCNAVELSEKVTIRNK